MELPLFAPLHIPGSMFLKAQTDHYLEAGKHNICHCKQDNEPEESPGEGPKGKVSSVYCSQHSYYLKTHDRAELVRIGPEKVALARSHQTLALRWLDLS